MKRTTTYSRVLSHLIREFSQVEGLEHTCNIVSTRPEMDRAEDFFNFLGEIPYLRNVMLCRQEEWCSFVFKNNKKQKVTIKVSFVDLSKMKRKRGFDDSCILADRII